MENVSMADDILIINGTILTMTEQVPELLLDGYLLIRDGRIAAIGSRREVAPPAPGRGPVQVIDAHDSLVMPGLINTHTHAAMTLFRGLADDLPLMTWLNDHIFPAEAAQVNPEMVSWCTKLAAAELIRCGTTTCADGYFHEDAAIAAFMETGLRAVAAQGVIDFPAPGVADPAENIRTAADFVSRWQGKDECITPAVFAHSPYTCSAATLQGAKELAREQGVSFFIHVAETRDEVRQIQARHRSTPIRYLESLGVLDRDTVCVHCVWLDAEDIGVLARTGARVVTCPTSNMKLGAGIAPVVEKIAQGIVVGLGTDSCASNNRLDLFAEMAMCAKLHKVHHHDPTVLPARRVLQMATADGAAVLGMADRIGSLAPGKCADIIIIDLNQPHLVPFYNPDLLVYAAGGSDVTTAIINGRLVMQDRRLLTFDVEEAMAKVRELSRKLIR
jgi:5-methylthioadenosine/S-adenosylhomocysteine deaminase